MDGNGDADGDGDEDGSGIAARADDGRQDRALRESGR